MKTIDDIKLEAKISDMIVETFDGIIAPDVMHRDVVGMAEALALKIISQVKGKI